MSWIDPDDAPEWTTDQFERAKLNATGDAQMMDTKALESAVADINALVRGEEKAPPVTDVELPAELVLMAKAAEAAVEAAQQVFTAAENALRETKAYAEKLKAEAQERAEALAELRHRTEKFGHATLDAFKRFHDGRII